MDNEKSDTWRIRDLYELLAPVLFGGLAWAVGSQFRIFRHLDRYIAMHGLSTLLVVTSLIGIGALLVSIQRAMRLREAVAARARAEALAETIERRDPLTGLANRRLLHERLAAALATRAPSETFAVMQIDLDRFKPVNDFHGHAAGNAVLRAVADRLRAIVPPASTVARLGGDEFVVLLPGGLDLDAIDLLAKRILATLQRPIPWNHGSVEIDSTIGVAMASNDRADADALMHAADIAMYRGKREGRGTYRFFRAEMDVALKARAQLEIDLKAAISNGDVVPYYQPIVALPGKDLVGFEVLARWEHQTRGAIGPDEFVPIAEECGMISDLFYNVLRKACADARAWPPHLQLAVNVSPYQLQDHRLPHTILAILTQTGFAPGRLEIEITETALINDLEAARLALTSLQALGVKIALDDFGTGYSSLYHLRELRFNKLKIDRSYVTSLEQGSERAKLVDAIIQLGSSLSLQTTAEGIENETNLTWLSEQGCTFGQGFFFGRPMAKRDADIFLQKGPGAEPRKTQMGPMEELSSTPFKPLSASA